MVPTKMREESDPRKDSNPNTISQLPQTYERLVGRKIAKMKKAVRMKNNTW
jgi:hypothetical protein